MKILLEKSLKRSAYFCSEHWIFASLESLTACLLVALDLIVSLSPDDIATAENTYQKLFGTRLSI